MKSQAYFDSLSNEERVRFVYTVLTSWDGSMDSNVVKALTSTLQSYIDVGNPAFVSMSFEAMMCDLFIHFDGELIISVCAVDADAASQKAGYGSLDPDHRGGFNLSMKDMERLKVLLQLSNL